MPNFKRASLVGSEELFRPTRPQVVSDTDDVIKETVDRPGRAKEVVLRDQTGKTLSVSSRGVREIKMMQTKGFSPTAPWTAQDVADHAAEVFFPEEAARVPA